MPLAGVRDLVRSYCADLPDSGSQPAAPTDVGAWPFHAVRRGRQGVYNVRDLAHQVERAEQYSARFAREPVRTPADQRPDHRRVGSNAPVTDTVLDRGCDFNSDAPDR